MFESCVARASTPIKKQYHTDIWKLNVIFNLNMTKTTETNNTEKFVIVGQNLFVLIMDGEQNVKRSLKLVQ